MRLNKYIAHSGLCSRRKAAELVKTGKIRVNGEVEKNPAILVGSGDKVEYKNRILKPEKNLVYILLNKPKDTVSTVSDEKGRRTVIDILGDKIEERIYPVGRLDRDTTGLLVLTNDGDLAKKLSHPSHKVKKIYHVVLDRNLSQKDFNLISEGIILEDGLALVDKISYIKGSPANEVGMELHIGKNRLIRRIFEHLGYEVTKLDRVAYAGLTKKDLPRGRFRYLNSKEVIMLKHFI